MVKYDWEILKLITAPSLNSFTNAVVKVNWRYQATEGGYFADKYFVTALSEPTEGNTFTSFDELTGDQVFSWISSNEDIDALKQQLLDKLEEEKNPSSLEKEVPWNRTQYSPNQKFMIVVDGNPNVTNKVLGPFSWDSSLANKFLSGLNVGYQFTTTGVMFSKGLLPIDEPLVINDRITVYKASYANENDFNKDLQTVTSVSWDISSGEAIGTYSFESKSLDTIKDDVKNTLEEHYKKKKIVSIDFEDQFTTRTVDEENPEEVTDPETGVVSYKFNTITETTQINTSIYTSEDVYLEAIGTLALMNEDETVQCRVNNTDSVLVNFVIMRKIVKTILDHYETVSSWKAEILTSIESASSIEELQSIELSISEA
jgi:hypothetical protein